MELQQRTSSAHTETWRSRAPCRVLSGEDEKQSEVCDCTYLEVNQNKCIIAVGWDRRINVYFDAPCDFHHFWKPRPHWQDDLVSPGPHCLALNPNSGTCRGYLSLRGSP
uniref:Uncharacterized protein n=1 Tax=Felis catus TaxID=9685 RepID=A0ABI7YAV2_FELCA